MSIEEGPINCLNDQPTTYYSIAKVTDSVFFSFQIFMSKFLGDFIKNIKISQNYNRPPKNKKTKIQFLSNFFIEKWRNFARKQFTGPSLTVQFKSLFLL
jgi:hypothetical protein